MTVGGRPGSCICSVVSRIFTRSARCHSSYICESTTLTLGASIHASRAVHATPAARAVDFGHRPDVLVVLPGSALVTRGCWARISLISSRRARQARSPVIVRVAASDAGQTFGKAKRLFLDGRRSSDNRSVRSRNVPRHLIRIDASFPLSAIAAAADQLTERKRRFFSFRKREA